MHDFEQHDAKAEHVRGIDLLVVHEHFGGHVWPGAPKAIAFTSGGLGQAKVGHLGDQGGRVDQYVVRFQIAMQQAFAMPEFGDNNKQENPQLTPATPEP